MKETNRNRANVAKRRARQRKLRNRRIALTVCLMLVVMVASIGGTVAWLTATTDPVTNTFTYGNINITLAETTGNSYKIIPGVDISKDPKVTVVEDSEACYLFVKVEETGDFVEDKVTYSIDLATAEKAGWTALEEQPGVYYRVVDADTAKAGATFDILAGNKITVSSDLTKDDLKNVKVNPTLKFTAYAVQKDGITSVTDAWAKVNP